MRASRLLSEVTVAVALLGSGMAASVAHAVSITEIKLPIAGSEPVGIAKGPDGNLWFTEYGGNRIGRITPAGTITDWSTGSGISSDSMPNDIVTGPDGNLWFTETFAARVARMNASGNPHATEFTNGITRPADPSRESLRAIAAGPDGNVWFIESQLNAIGRIAPNGTVAEFTAGLSPGSGPNDIVAGPDGNLWFTEGLGNRIGRITPGGAISETSLGISPGSGPAGITVGPDGNLWFTEGLGNRIARITPAGIVTEFSMGLSPASSPSDLTAGPDGNLWFIEADGNRIGRITPSGVITEFSSGLSPIVELKDIVAGPDDNIWFTEYLTNSIGRLILDPIAATGGAGALGATGETLNGTVTPYGAPTSYVFEYGRTTSYGTATNSQAVAIGTMPVAVTARIGGLRPNTLYHYRLVASSAGGTSFGNDQTFTTALTGSSPPAPIIRRAGPRMAILAGAFVRAKGVLRIRLTCPLAETLGCHGRVRLETTGRRPTTLGTGGFRIGGGATQTLAISIPRRLRGRITGAKPHIKVVVMGIDAFRDASTTVKILSLSRQ